MARYMPGTYVITPNKQFIRGQSPSLQVVYLWLCDYIDDDGYCYPSAQRLAEDAGISRNTVFSALKRLEELGLINRVSRSNGKEQLSNGYYILNLEGSATIGLPSATVGLGSSAMVVHEVTSIIKSLNEVTPHTPQEGFEEFWKEYPRKIAKPNALKAWKSLSPTVGTRKEIIQGLTSWKKTKQWTKDNGQFIPHPATFLNQRRWEDEITNKAPSNTKYDNISTKL